MLTAHHLAKTYGIHPILRGISFSISARERIGLIGPNGCGKTTLMRILAGIEQPDAGTVALTRPGIRIGYLAQGLELAPGQTIQAVLGLSTVSTEALEAEVASLAANLAARPGDLALAGRYEAALATLSTVHHPPSKILGPLGLGDFAMETPVSHLSGGQKTRLMLARVLLNDPHLLLLDEPTNHLDIAMLEWLESWLNNFRGAALIVSHDRAFLDNSVGRILELVPATQSLKSYSGNYTDYVEQKLTEQEHQIQAYSDQQEQIAQLRAAAAHLRGLTKMKKGGKADGGDKFATGFFGNRATKNTAGRAKHLEARIEKILGEEKIEKPRPSWQLKLDFGAPSHQSKDVLLTENLSVGYPDHKPLLRGLNINVRAGQRIAMTGPNGAGKTTLVRTIYGKLEPVSGSLKLGANVRMGYMSQEQELLDLALSPLQIIQKISPFNETEARHFLHFFLFGGDDPLRPSGEMSYGERARLQLAVLVAQGCTFLLLDEPINHLDIPARARFEQALAKFEGTILAVVHDRYFIERFATDVWTVEQGSVKKC
jgi:ATP-binding cassette subfamily F protein 3